MGELKVHLISIGASSLTEKVVFLRMLIEKVKFLDIRMTDYIKKQLRENEQSPNQDIEDEELRKLKPNIHIESDANEESDIEEELDDGLEIEFEEEGGDEEEIDNSMPIEDNYNKQMDFGSRFNNKDLDEEDTKIDV